MTCQNCGDELKQTTVFRNTDSVLEMQQGLECHRCGAIYNTEGVQLEPPYSERRDEDEEQPDES